MRILFLGETYRADAQTWIRGIEKVSGLPIQTKEIPKTGGRMTRILHAVKFFFSLAFSGEKFDLVLAERATSYGFFSLFVNAKVRVVAQQGISDVWPTNGFAGWYKGILQRSVYTKADLIHAWGFVMTHAMINSGAPLSRILVRPKGLDLARFRLGSLSEKQEDLAIVTRSLFPIYRHQEIVEAIAILHKKGIKLRCNMVGDGIEMESLQAKTSELSLNDQIQWLGRIHNDDLPFYLKKSGIYIAVPETEGVSASLFEAMACGCFPIVSDLPANRAFINSGKNGFLVPVGDPVALAGAIEKYLHHPENFAEGILQNRSFIEKSCNIETNMRDFFLRYSHLINQKA